VLGIFGIVPVPIFGNLSPLMNNALLLKAYVFILISCEHVCYQYHKSLRVEALLFKARDVIGFDLIGYTDDVETNSLSTIIHLDLIQLFVYLILESGF